VPNRNSKLKSYYFTSLLGVIFAVVGFSYNAWRLEVSESNSTVRTASFEVLTELAALERVIYAGHYDNNEIQGSPRNGWVHVGVITDLSMLISNSTEKEAETLKETWAQNWGSYAQSREATDKLIHAIEAVRTEIKTALNQLK